MATVILRNRHSLEGLSLIKRIRDGKRLHVDELASFQEGKPLADLSIEELKSSFKDTLRSEDILDDVLQMVGRVVNLDNCRLAVHEAICFANKFGHPQDQQLHESSSSAAMTETKAATSIEVQPLVKYMKNLNISVENVQNAQIGNNNALIVFRGIEEDAQTNYDKLSLKSEVSIRSVDNKEIKYSASGPTNISIGNNCEIIEVKLNKEIVNDLKNGKFTVTKEDNLLSVTWYPEQVEANRKSVKINFSEDQNITELEKKVFEKLADCVDTGLVQLITELLQLCKARLKHIKMGCIELEFDLESDISAVNLQDKTEEIKDLIRRTIMPEDAIFDVELHSLPLTVDLSTPQSLEYKKQDDVMTDERDLVQVSYSDGSSLTAGDVEDKTEEIKDLIRRTIMPRGAIFDVELHSLPLTVDLSTPQSLEYKKQDDVMTDERDLVQISYSDGSSLTAGDVEAVLKMSNRNFLFDAVKHNDLLTVNSLIQSGACDVNIQDSGDNTPLHIAVNEKNIEIVKCIVEKGNCDVSIKNQKGYSPFSSRNGLQILHKIAECQDVELFHVLIKRNVDVLTNHVDNQLQLVEFILIENDFQSLWFLIQNGLFINSLTSSGENIVHLLAQFYIDYFYIDFSFLFDYGLDFELINNDGNSPLMVASLLNNAPIIQFLAAVRCDANKQNHQGHTALHLCVIGFTLIKEKLNMMKQNSVVKKLCAFEYYPRYLACIDVLINLGADVSLQDIKGKTVLMMACMKNDRKLLETLLIGGADVNIVDNHGRSALQYIDLTNNVFDLTCFYLLLSHGCRQSFNQPCLNGNTIIQNVLQFTPLWQVDDTVNFIKFLVFKNVNLQLLSSGDGEISYGQLSLEEFSSESRHELRQILYLSGGSFVQITQILHFEVEESYEASLPSVKENPREKFYLFANNLSLGEICRRVIRQNTGLEIHDRISELIEIPILTEFLLFKDIDSRPFSLPVQLEYSIDDDYEDDYDSYDLNTEHDDYENDYVVYIYCKYLNEAHAGLKR